jgi:two-component system, NarL family, sensor histidine kinase DesK
MISVRDGPADAAGAGLGRAASRRASAFAAAVLCLLLIAKAAYAAWAGQAGEVPFVAALFVLPLLYAFPGSRRLLDRYRWPVLVAQGVLTWVPFAVFGDRWVVGIGGLLAGLMLLTVRGRVSWLAAGLLLAADVAVRAAVIGLPPAPAEPAWSGALWAAVAFVDNGLLFFGMARLAQIVGQVEDARSQAAELAVVRERLQAAESLQAAIGQRLDGIAASAAAARRALAHDPAGARAQIAAAGVTARDAVARARAVTADQRLAGPEPPVPARSMAVVGSRLAWAVLVVVLSAFAAQGINNVFLNDDGPGPGILAAAAIALMMALQLYHSRAARQGGRARAWPLTLALQAVLAYAFFLPFGAADAAVLAPFLAGSVLLLVPRWWRWAGYAAVIASCVALYVTVPPHALIVAVRDPLYVLYLAGVISATGLMVYGLSWLTGLARELEGLQGELARMAAVRERLRVARDVHDLLGLGLSAVALKTDLIGRLIGRDDPRAAAEIDEMARVCAAARADVRMVTGGGQRLTLDGELAAARQILASAGVEVHAAISGGQLPSVADEVLAPVLREAVTNILRHSTATACTIHATATGNVLRLAVSNDGVTGQAGPAGGDEEPGERTGKGLANLTARVAAAGGRLATRQADGRFELTAQIPVSPRASASAATGPAQAPAASPVPGRPAGSR